MPILLTDSPCTGRCEFDSDKTVCLGCGRLRAEVKQWKAMGDAERHDVNMRLLVTQGKKVRKRILRQVAKALGKHEKPSAR